MFITNCSPPSRRPVQPAVHLLRHGVEVFDEAVPSSLLRGSMRPPSAVADRCWNRTARGGVFGLHRLSSAQADKLLRRLELGWREPIAGEEGTSERAHSCISTSFGFANISHSVWLGADVFEEAWDGRRVRKQESRTDWLQGRYWAFIFLATHGMGFHYHAHGLGPLWTPNLGHSNII